MPLTRYQTRNEYSLADPELYRAADKDDPEALLEGVAMAGLVGVLRQLGDLSEFAAEIFHDLHEEVMATAARGHGLMLRVQQLEAEVPSIEREFLSRTSHSPFLFNAGVGWHANLRMGQNMITRGDLPRCVMDSYEECRGPPRLFLLDKFDVAGTGACLKRYSDPSFFKAEFSSSETMGADVQREKNAHKVKKKGSRWRNGEKPEVHPTSHVKLHQLLSKERNSENNVKLKKRQLNGFPLKSTTGKSYMDRFLEAHSPEREVSYENSLVLPHLNMESSNTSELGLEIREIGTASPDNKLLLGERGLDSSVEKQETALERSMYNLHDDVIKKSVLEKLPEPICDIEIEEVPSSLHKLQDQKVLMVDKESNKEAIVDGYQSDDITSEVDSYMDALATIESEIETDTETRRNNERGFINTKRLGMDFETKEQEKHEAYFSESSSVGNSSESDDETSLFERGRSNPSNMDTLSNLAVKGSPGGDAVAKVATSAGICPVEVVDVSSEKPSVNGNTLVHEPLEYIAPNGSCNEVSVIPSYGSKLVEASPYSCVTDSTATVSRSSPGANLNEFQLQGPDFVGYPSAFMRLSTGAPSLNTEEDTENIGVGVPSSTNLSYSASQMKDDPLSVGFLKSQQMKVMDGLTHLEVSSDALLHQSDISSLVVEGKYDGDNLEAVLPTKCAEDTFTENMSRNHDLPHSVTLPTEGQPSSLEGHDLKVCSSTKQPECLPATISPDDLDDFKSARTLESDIGIQTAGENPEYLISALNIQKTGVSAEQGLSELTEEVLPPQLDIGVGTGSSGVKTLYNNLEVSSNKPAGGVNDEPALDVVQLNSYGSVGNAAAATSSMETDKTLQFAYRNQSNEGAEDPVFTSLSHQELSIPSEQALVLEASPRLSNLLDEQTDSLKGRDQNGCAVVDGANNKQGSQTSEIEETPPPNPFLPLPTTEDEKPEHDSLTFKEEKAQTSLNSFAPPPATEEVRPASDTSQGESGDIQNLSVLKLNIKDGMLQLPVIKDEEPLNSFAPPTIKEEQPLNAFASPTIKDEKPLNAFAPPAMTDEEPSNSSLTLEGEMPSNESNTIPDAEVGMPNGKPPRKPPRPRDPLIEAVASHDRSTLRKVTERVRPQIVQKMDERDAMLDQIRTKSFNLKPTGRPMVTTRSMIQGPRTNLKVAAILEKANAIRQATAGSDEDDDDSWSDC